MSGNDPASAVPVEDPSDERRDATTIDSVLNWMGTFSDEDWRSLRCDPAAVERLKADLRTVSLWLGDGTFGAALAAVGRPPADPGDGPTQEDFDTLLRRLTVARATVPKGGPTDRVLAEAWSAISHFAAAARPPADTSEVDRLRRELAEQRAYHEAFRPEVVAEVAVNLSDETDWESIAEWCGGSIRSMSNPSGEYDSWIDLPDGQTAGRGMWITLDHGGQYRVRNEVQAPPADTTARPPTEGDEDEAGCDDPHCDACGGYLGGVVARCGFRLHSGQPPFPYVKDCGRPLVNGVCEKHPFARPNAPVPAAGVQPSPAQNEEG